MKRQSKKPGRMPRAGVTMADSDRIQVRVSATERALWTLAAEREGLSLSEWVRAACELAWTRGSTR